VAGAPAAAAAAAAAAIVLSVFQSRQTTRTRSERRVCRKRNGTVPRARQEPERGRGSLLRIPLIEPLYSGLLVSAVSVGIILK